MTSSDRTSLIRRSSGARADAACPSTRDARLPIRRGDAATELPTCELDSDANAVLRAVACAPVHQPRSAIAAGTRWSDSGRYLIDYLLGRGGMGTVYAATDTVLGRAVALKILDAAGADHDAAHHARLLREAQLAARVEHERIARVYDVGAHDGFAFVAMEHVAGGTLRQWMTAHDVSVPQVVDIATQIAEGLAALHAKGVIHRDLKPENVMLTAQGGIKLLDFGLARHTVAAPDEPGAPDGAAVLDGATITSVCGTPGYMAPEQYTAQPIDARVDIFALGVIIYELVTGERLFRGATARAAMTATFAGVPALRDGIWDHVPERLRDHTARMLAHAPEARFEDGSRVLAALRELGGAMPLPRRPLAAATVQAFGKAPTQRALPPGPRTPSSDSCASSSRSSASGGTPDLLVHVKRSSARRRHPGFAAKRLVLVSAVAAVVVVLAVVRPWRRLRLRPRRAWSGSTSGRAKWAGASTRSSASAWRSAQAAIASRCSARPLAPG